MNRLAKSLQFIGFLTLLLCFQSQNANANKIEKDKQNPRLKEFIEQAKEVETTNKTQLEQVARQMIEYSSDSMFQMLGNFYLSKAKFYGLPSVENAKKLDELRDFFEEKKMYDYLYEIDRVMILTSYRDLNYFEAAQRINNMNEYILEEEYSAERSALIHTTNQNPQYLYTPENKRILEETIAQIKDKNSSTYVSLSVALSNYYNHVGDVYDSNAILEGLLTELNDHSNNLYKAFVQQILAGRRESSEQTISELKQSIKYLEDAEFKLMQNAIWRDLGYNYEKIQEYELAYNAFSNAIRLDEDFKDSISFSIDQANAAKALYYLHPEQLENEVANHFNEAFASSRNHPYTLQNLYNNQIEVYKHAGLLSKAENYQKLLAELDDQQDEFIEDNAQDFITKKMLEYHTKDLMIDDLKRSNLAQKNKIRLQRYIIILSVLLGIGLLYISHLSIQNNYFTKSLKRKSQELEIANEELERKNEQIRKQYYSLHKKEQQLRAQLQSKISILQSQSKSIIELEKNILEDEQLETIPKKQYLKKLNEINTNVGLVDETKIQLRELHKSFVDRLVKQHPDLTSNNIMLCIYLRMNLSTKDIAMLIQSNTNTIRVARNRLRKKLGITGDDQRLSTYIHGI